MSTTTAARDTVRVGQSLHPTAAHARRSLRLARQQIQARVVSRDLTDFRPLAGNIPVALNNGGSAIVNATITRQTERSPRHRPRRAHQLRRPGPHVLRASPPISTPRPSGPPLTNARPHARRAPGELQRHCRTPQLEARELPAAQARRRLMRNADIADVLALAGQSDIQATGALTARRAPRRHRRQPDRHGRHHRRQRDASRASTSTVSPPAPS